MIHSRELIRNMAVRVFDCLLRLYPPCFRLEFSAEIREVFLSRISGTEKENDPEWLAIILQEITGLVMSIFRECWHELWARKEKEMVPENKLVKDTGAKGGQISTLRPAGTPGALWLISWTLLTTAAIPAALIVMTPLAVIFMRLINLGVKAGLWPVVHNSTLEPLGLVTGLALTLSTVQWYLLRNFLPRAWLWFTATSAGIFLSGLAIGLALWRSSVQSWDPIWIMAAALLPVGLTLGLVQWFYLRRFLPNAFWIIFIDVLATGSILLAGRSFTSLMELMILVLPGIITGLGLWLLMNQSQPTMPPQVRTVVSLKKDHQMSHLIRKWLWLVGLIPLFFVCIWVYAASQISLAKNEGIYATPEEAVIANNSKGWGGARVVSIQGVWAEPNSRDTHPHVWFGGATVYLDRVPRGGNKDHYSSGSFYLHVREGWVHIPEGAFPEFIGWVMELYNMERVRE